MNSAELREYHKAPEGSFGLRKPEAVSTVEKWLVEHFGESAREIDGLQSWGRTEISGASFTVCG